MAQSYPTSVGSKCECEFCVAQKTMWKCPVWKENADKEDTARWEAQTKFRRIYKDQDDIYRKAIALSDALSYYKKEYKTNENEPVADLLESLIGETFNKMAYTWKQTTSAGEKVQEAKMKRNIIKKMKNIDLLGRSLENDESP